MFQERRALLGEVWDHYKSLASQLGTETLVDRATMLGFCPTPSELAILGYPEYAREYKPAYEHEVNYETGEVTIKRKKFENFYENDSEPA